MSKHINMSGLKTLLEPLIHLIDKKAERPDWNENDPNSSSYIANRTHYEETNFKQFLDTSISLDSNGIYDIYPSSFSLQEGNSYKVIWDGITYDCIARYDGYSDFYIGNQEFAVILGGWGFPEVIESNEPFFIAINEGYDEAIFFGVEGNHTITLSGEDTVIHKIDEKYLPNLIGAKGTVEGAEIFNDYEYNMASGMYSHAEGVDTKAYGYASHAEGEETLVLGRSSHAEGTNTEAIGTYSHAEGYYTEASSDYQHVQGKWNVIDSSHKYAHIVGNGTNGMYRSNAHTLDWNGNAWFAGDIYIGGTNQNNGEKLAKVSELPKINLVNGTAQGSLRTVGSGQEDDDYKLGTNAFSQGILTKAIGQAAHAEGKETVALGNYSNAQGYQTLALGLGSHVEGCGYTLEVKLTGDASSTTLKCNYYGFCKPNQIVFLDEKYARIISVNLTDGTITLNNSLSSQPLTEAKAIIMSQVASGNYSHAEGREAYAIGDYSHVEGYYSTAQGSYSHAEGFNTDAVGIQSHAEGWLSNALGNASHAEGYEGTASNTGAHAEGSFTKASGNSAHAEGYHTEAKGPYTHAEGCYTEAIGECSHASGYYTKAIESYLTVIGKNNKTSEDEDKYKEVIETYQVQFGENKNYAKFNQWYFSPKEGFVITSGTQSADLVNLQVNDYIFHTYDTFVNGNVETYYKILQVIDSSSFEFKVERHKAVPISSTLNNCAFMVGNGSGISTSDHSNAHTLDWDGNAWYSGDVYVGSTSGTNKDEGSKKLATEEFVSNAIAAIPTPDVSDQITEALNNIRLASEVMF